MKTALKLTFVGAGIAASNVGAAQEAPDPGTVHIVDMNHNGTGCRRGTVAHNLSDDGQALTLLFDDFVIETRRGRVASKNCVIDMDLHVPAGWTFAVMNVGFRGYAALDEGVRVKHNTVYRFSDYAFRDTPDLELKGPYFDDYEYYTDVPLAARSWSKCSRRDETKQMKIRTRMGLVKAPGNRQAEGLVTVDSIDASIVQKYAIRWQRCGGQIEPEANLQPTTCGANLMDRSNRVLAVFPADREAGDAYNRPLQARTACNRQKGPGQQCKVVRTGCR